MQTDPPAGVSASPIADNVMTWYDSPLTPARDTAPALRSPQLVTHRQLKLGSQHR
jgi:hypothetical protein